MGRAIEQAFIKWRNNKRGYLFILFLTFLFLLLIFWQLDIKNLEKNLHSLLSFQVLLGFFLYLASYLLRAIRWQILLGREFLLTSLFHIVSLHTVANNIFPFRSGELTFLYFCRRFHNIPISISTPTLVSARFADLCALGPLFFFSLLYFGFPLSKFVTVLIFIFIFFSLAYLLPHILGLLQWALGHIRMGEGITKHLSSISECYKSQWHGWNLAMLLFISLSIWVVKFLAFYFMVNGLVDPTTFHLTYWKVVLGSTASELVAALPIQSFAEFGMFEAGWSGAFIFMGMGKRAAVTSGFSLHLIMLLFSLIIGIPAYLAAFLRRSQTEEYVESSSQEDNL